MKKKTTGRKSAVPNRYRLYSAPLDTFYLVVCPSNILRSEKLFPNPALFATEDEANQMVKALDGISDAVVVPVCLGKHGTWPLNKSKEDAWEDV